MQVEWERNDEGVMVFTSRAKKQWKVVQPMYIPFEVIRTMAMLSDQYEPVYGACFQPGMSAAASAVFKSVCRHFLDAPYDSDDSDDSDDDVHCFNCGSYGHTSNYCVKCDYCGDVHGMWDCPTQPHFVYVLELSGNKWYVGETTDLDERVAQHREGDGAVWTKRFNTVRLNKSETVDYEHRHFIEFVETIRQMNARGIDNVRGGPFCRLRYTAAEKIAIARLVAYCMQRSEAEVLIQNGLV